MTLLPLKRRPPPQSQASRKRKVRLYVLINSNATRHGGLGWWSDCVQLLMVAANPSSLWNATKCNAALFFLLCWCSTDCNKVRLDHCDISRFRFRLIGQCRCHIVCLIQWSTLLGPPDYPLKSEHTHRLCPIMHKFSGPV